jgi:hypothetical protein
MKVTAKEREFNIFELFLHDSDAADVCPFDPQSLRAWLNKKAEELYPEYHVEFVSADDTFASSCWYVHFNLNRYDYEGDQVRYVSYPTERVHDERSFRRQLPPELDEVLLELNKAAVEL